MLIECVCVFTEREKKLCCSQHWMLSLKTCKLELVCGWQHSFCPHSGPKAILNVTFQSGWMKLKEKYSRKKAPSILKRIYVILKLMCARCKHTACACKYNGFCGSYSRIAVPTHISSFATICTKHIMATRRWRVSFLYVSTALYCVSLHVGRIL